VKPQGPRDRSFVDVDFLSVKEARNHKAISSDDEETSGIFFRREPGCHMVFKEISELESNLDGHLGKHREEPRWFAYLERKDGLTKSEMQDFLRQSATRKRQGELKGAGIGCVLRGGRI